jgi:hypothetical protein
MKKIFLKIIILLILIIITSVRSQSNTCTRGSSAGSAVTCYNGGTCMTTGNTDCICAPGYTGPTCLCKYKHLI